MTVTDFYNHQSLLPRFITLVTSSGRTPGCGLVITVWASHRAGCCWGAWPSCAPPPGPPCGVWSHWAPRTREYSGYPSVSAQRCLMSAHWWGTSCPRGPTSPGSKVCSLLTQPPKRLTKSHPRPHRPCSVLARPRGCAGVSRRIKIPSFTKQWGKYARIQSTVKLVRTG